MSRPTLLRRIPLLLLLAHLYVLVRLIEPALGTRVQWVVPVVIAALYALILAGFLARRQAGRLSGDVLSWSGFLALGCFSWLFVLTLLRDAVLFLLMVGSAITPSLKEATNHAPAITALAVPILTMLAVLLGLFNARRMPRLVDVDVPIPDLPDSLHDFTIAQISDLHVGSTIKRPYVRRVVDAVNRLKPDIITLTGDLVDGSVALLASDVAPLSGLQAKEGVYAVTGNHEYYSGAGAWVAEYRRLGMDVLMNQHRVIHRGGALLVVAGVTDFTAERFDSRQACNPVAALRAAPREAAARILLAHQPRTAADAAKAGFDLQLSGHTHGGQFWPWPYFVSLQQPYVAGLHRLDKLLIYVSRGTGYWGPPMRLGARSEITRLRLRRQA
ncbi:MAG TPA: metallophosphoesterase [Burkholderiaceae bacterium]|nr:metallophosphoesterase [Burkholderiaceae bacterium]